MRVLRAARPCPRVEISAANAELNQVLTCTIDERLRGLAAELFAALFGHRSPDARARLIRRMATALNSERVASARKLREEMELERRRSH